MDNLAHTLVGASLAEAGFKRVTALATPTLMIAANLPDIDVLASLAGHDAMLEFRRGWTHGVLAWIALPPMLAGVVLAFDRLVRRQRRPDADRARFGALVGLSYLGVLTHPLLDWLNVYGVRLLMPFDDRWFYGDALFISDPWLWLLCGSSVVLAHSRSKMSIAGWAVLGLGSTALVLGYAEVSTPVKIVWLLAVSAIATLRVGGVLIARTRRVAIITLSIASLYVAAMVSGGAYASRAARAEFEARGIPVDDVLAKPVPGNPLAREGLIVSPEEYRFFAIDLLADPPLVETRTPVPIDEPDPIVEAALSAPQIRGFRNWMRFPSWEVRTLDDGYLVILRDLRFAEADADAGFGVVRVELDPDRKPR